LAKTLIEIAYFYLVGLILSSKRIEKSRQRNEHKSESDLVEAGQTVETKR